MDVRKLNKEKSQDMLISLPVRQQVEFFEEFCLCFKSAFNLKAYSVINDIYIFRSVISKIIKIVLIVFQLE